MAKKNWKVIRNENGDFVGTKTPVTVHQMRKVDLMVKNATEVSKKFTDELYDQKKAREDSLVNAYNDKKLKSERLIKEAQNLIKKREKTAPSVKAED